MYGLADLRRALDSPRAVGRELNRLYHRRLKTRPYNTLGIDVFEEDWDNLLILDSCRYDEFQRAVEFAGRLESRTSRGSTTFEWVRANFAGRQLYDTVYVSANSWFLKLEEEINASVHDYIVPEWDGEGGERFNPAEKSLAERGMHPEIVTEAAAVAAEEYPNKRLLVHYMQPHQPYIGSTGVEQFEHDGEVMQRLTSGDREVDKELLLQAYRENLEIVLDHVEDLLAQLEGKTVVSADHGEMLGDRYSPFPIRDYGHNPGLYVPQLVQVPWYIIDCGERREIVSERPTGQHDDLSTEEIDERLRDLGYAL